VGARADNAQPRLRGLLLAIFVSAMPGTIILPMIPSLGREFGVSSAALGLLFGIYPLTSVIAGPLWGRISDRLGRKPALLGSLAGTAVSFVLFGLATSYEGLFLARALQGLSGSARGIGFAVMGDTTEGAERAAGIGSVSASMALAFTVGPVVGAAFMGEHPGLVLRVLREAIGAPATGFDHLLPSLVGALMNVAAFLIVLTGFTETLRRRPQESAHEDGGRPGDNSLAAALASAVVLVLITQFALSGLIQGTLQFSFTLLANTVLAWTAQQVALSLAALGLGFVLASGVFMRPLLRRFTPAQVMLGGVLIDIAGMLLFLGNPESGTVVLAGLFVSSLGGGFWATIIVGMISREAPEAHQGLVMGIANGAGLVGRVAGPPLAGLAAESFGAHAPFGAILACQFLILLTVIGRMRAARRVASAHQGEDHRETREAAQHDQRGADIMK
jgi:DHA1 family tetracycline resistance protein-like MFS transporter